MAAVTKPLINARTPAARLGWAIRKRRQVNHLSQSELARQILVSRQRLSATEQGDAARGLGPAAIPKLDSALSASGTLTYLRSELRHLAHPSPQIEFLNEDERLTINHKLRHGLPVRAVEALYVDAFELRAIGGRDQKVQRTLEALVDLTQSVSTVDNGLLSAALAMFSREAFPLLSERAMDLSNISPWRFLDVMSTLPGRGAEVERAASLILDTSHGLGDRKRHRPAIDALIGLPRLSDKVSIELREIARNPDCFSEPRTQALIVLGRREVDPDRRRVLARSLASVTGGPMVEAAIRSLFDAPAGIGGIRLGPVVESRLGQRLEVDAWIGSDPVARSLVYELIRSPSERVRRAAALTLTASGLRDHVTNIFLDLIEEDASADVIEYVARNAIGLLRSPASQERLFAFHTYPFGPVRAHIAWSLSRVTTSWGPDFQAWLDGETDIDCKAALQQIKSSTSVNSNITPTGTS